MPAAFVRPCRAASAMGLKSFQAATPVPAGASPPSRPSSPSEESSGWLGLGGYTRRTDSPRSPLVASWPRFGSTTAASRAKKRKRLLSVGSQKSGWAFVSPQQTLTSPSCSTRKSRCGRRNKQLLNTLSHPGQLIRSTLPRRKAEATIRPRPTARSTSRSPVSGRNCAGRLSSGGCPPRGEGAAAGGGRSW